MVIYTGNAPWTDHYCAGFGEWYIYSEKVFIKKTLVMVSNGIINEGSNVQMQCSCLLLGLHFAKCWIRCKVEYQIFQRKVLTKRINCNNPFSTFSGSSRNLNFGKLNVCYMRVGLYNL